jgi:ATP-binding cassette, subfamily B, multidrug efflux pump
VKEEVKSGNVFDFQILKRLFGFTRPYRGLFWIVVLLTLLSAVLGPVKPWIIKKTIDNQIAEKDLPGLFNMTALLVGLLFLHGIIQYLHTYISGVLGQNVIRDVRVQLYNHLLTFRLSYFDKTPIGRLVTRNVSDVQQLNEVFSQGIANIVSDSLQVLVIIGFMFYSSWKLTLLSLSVLPFLLISTYVFKEKVKYAFNRVRNAVANLNTFVQEHITGMNIVQIFNAEDREYKKFVQINDEHKNANLLSVLYYSVYFPVTELIAAMGTAILVWYSARGILSEQITVGDYILFTMLTAMLFRPIRMIADNFNTLQMGIVSSSRIFQILDDNEFLQKDGNLITPSLKGHIRYDHVWFSYKEEEYILKDISFEVKPGETIAFVGATGSGKSTIINLLNRFYDIEKGNILIDGHDIKEYNLEFLRKNIAIVLQDVFLFSDSIANNITLYNPDISKEKILHAAELAGAREFIERLPGGLDYNVMERGATLSVGQRQLISFIRAIASDPAIIVMDEATSSVDSETEEMIKHAIEKLMTGRTSFVIAHRLSTIQKADKIVVLEKGEILETGRHEDLLKKQGAYAKLYETQFLTAESE